MIFSSEKDRSFAVVKSPDLIVDDMKRKGVEAPFMVLVYDDKKYMEKSHKIFDVFNLIGKEAKDKPLLTAEDFNKAQELLSIAENIEIPALIELRNEGRINFEQLKEYCGTVELKHSLKVDLSDLVRFLSLAEFLILSGIMEDAGIDRQSFESVANNLLEFAVLSAFRNVLRGGTDRIVLKGFTDDMCKQIIEQGVLNYFSEAYKNSEKRVYYNIFQDFIMNYQVHYSVIGAFYHGITTPILGFISNMFMQQQLDMFVENNNIKGGEFLN